MKKILIIEEPESCETCPLRSYSNLQLMCTPMRESASDVECPLKPLNKVVKAGDRNLIIYERAWLYSHLEEEFELQKKVRDWEKQNESNTCD